MAVSVVLHRTDPTRKMRRFYLLDVQPVRLGIDLSEPYRHARGGPGGDALEAG